MDLLSQLGMHGSSSDTRGEGCTCAPRLAEMMHVATCCPWSSQQHGSGAQEWRLGGRLRWLGFTWPWSHTLPHRPRAASARLCPQEAHVLNVVFGNEKTSCAPSAFRTVRSRSADLGAQDAEPFSAVTVKLVHILPIPKVPLLPLRLPSVTVPPPHPGPCPDPLDPPPWATMAKYILAVLGS